MEFEGKLIWEAEGVKLLKSGKTWFDADSLAQEL
jgi:hypothetical protein